VRDVGLPELDGYESARALRNEHAAAPTLIAATGYGGPAGSQVRGRSRVRLPLREAAERPRLDPRASTIA
jgi:CheY-like chemotaxis protein